MMPYDSVKVPTPKVLNSDLKGSAPQTSKPCPQTYTFVIRALEESSYLLYSISRVVSRIMTVLIDKKKTDRLTYQLTDQPTKQPTKMN